MDALFAVLSRIEPMHWLAIGLAFLVAEIVTGTTYLLWPAAAAALTGVFAFFMPESVAAQWAVFAVLTIALTFTGHFYVRGRWLKRDDSGTALNERGAALAGQKAIAEADFAAGFGRVRLNDTIWRAASSEAIARGEMVEIVSIDGATLQVKRA